MLFWCIVVWMWLVLLVQKVRVLLLCYCVFFRICSWQDDFIVLFILYNSILLWLLLFRLWCMVMYGWLGCRQLLVDILLVSSVFYQVVFGVGLLVVGMSWCCSIVCLVIVVIDDDDVVWLLCQCDWCVSVVLIIVMVVGVFLKFGVLCSVCRVWQLCWLSLKCSMCVLFFLICGVCVCRWVIWLCMFSCSGFSRGVCGSIVVVSMVQQIYWLIVLMFCNQCGNWCSVVYVQLSVYLVSSSVISVIYICGSVQLCCFMCRVIVQRVNLVQIGNVSRLVFISCCNYVGYGVMLLFCW